MRRWHIAPENDYRELEPAPHGTSRVAVVIPVYNRVALLARTVAGLVHQRFDGELQVVVADDGSDEDVNAALAPIEDHLDLTVVRREHEGYGAGQARNLGARTADAEVVVFIDADCVPDPELVARHAAWHGAADNLVVIGARHPLDTTEVTVERLLAGDLDLRAMAGLRSGGSPAGEAADGDKLSSPAHTAGEELLPSDWRRLLYRRTARLRRGDEAYRSLVSSNFSVRRDRFLEVGGFDEEFSRWGGEDTELGWRLQLAGLFFVPEDRAINYHQIQEDAGPEAWREAERAKNDGIIRAKIPHRFYRSESRRGVVYQAPKISLVAAPVNDRRAEALLDELLRQRFTDWSATLVGDGEQLRRLGEELLGDPRFEVLPAGGDDLDAALLEASRRATGEYVCYLDGDASLDPRLLARAAKELDRNPRRCRVSVGYRLAAPTGPGGGSDAPDDEPVQSIDYRRPEDLVALDGRYGPGALPAFALVRRRDVGKALGAADTASQLWEQVGQLGGWSHLDQAMVGLPSTPQGDPPDFRAAPTTVLGELRATKDPRAVVRATKRKVRERRGGTRATAGRPATRPSGPRAIAETDESAATPIPLRYIGWVGHDNFGDEVLLRAVRQLLPWASIETSGHARKCVLLGGGTLINRGYLAQLDRMDSPRVERAVFGTGVANPEYWGKPREDPSDWVEYLSTCALVGVRGPISEQLLRGWGYQGPLEVIGDPALALERPDVERVDGRVVVSLCQSRGELWGGDDAAVFAAIATVVERLLADGREVHLLAASPRDDLAGIEVMRAAGAPDLPYLAAYRDEDAALELLASASIVIAERLHAAVVAAACDTPFVALEYRPKLRDFAQSVGAGDQVIRTDQLDAERLWGAVASTDARADELRGTVADNVKRYRDRLVRAGEQLREALQ